MTAWQASRIRALTATLNDDRTLREPQLPFQVKSPHPPGTTASRFAHPAAWGTGL